MTRRAHIFLDTSVIFAAVLSESGDSRLLLKLGEAGTCTLVVGGQVLSEADGVVKRKAPDQRAHLALLLDRANVVVGPAASEQDLEVARSVVNYLADAKVLAEAIAAGADRFVTLDRKHFLDRPGLSALPCAVETPGDCLTWLRRSLSSARD